MSSSPQLTWNSLGMGQIRRECTTTKCNETAALPLIICLVFLALPVTLELCRTSASLFRRDREAWKEHEETLVSGVGGKKTDWGRT